MRLLPAPGLLCRAGDPAGRGMMPVARVSRRSGAAPTPTMVLRGAQVDAGSFRAEWCGPDRCLGVRCDATPEIARSRSGSAPGDVLQVGLDLRDRPEGPLEVAVDR